MTTLVIADGPLHWQLPGLYISIFPVAIPMANDLVPLANDVAESFKSVQDIQSSQAAFLTPWGTSPSEEVSNRSKINKFHRTER